MSLITRKDEYLIGVIGGTGLETYFDTKLENVERIKPDTIFGSPSDEILTGTFHGIKIALLSRHGKKHQYNPTVTPFAANISALKALNCKIILSFCAVGSLKQEYEPGHLAVISDVIDRTIRMPRSLYDGTVNKKVMHMSGHPICNTKLRELIVQTLCKSEHDINTEIHETATIAVVEGPRFGSKAESFMLKSFGCDIVGMTFMPESIMAKEAGIAYANIALVTDYDCWLETDEPVTNDAVIKIMRSNAQHSLHALEIILPKIKSVDWSEEFKRIEKDVSMAIL